MSTLSFRLPAYRHMHFYRYHPYAVPDRQARHQAFDPVAYVMPPHVVDMFYPSSPAASSGLSGDSTVISDLALSANPANVNATTAFVEQEGGRGISGAAISFTGVRHSSRNSLGLSFDVNDEESASGQSTSSFVLSFFAGDDSESETSDSSVPTSPIAGAFPLVSAAPLPPLAGLANLRTFSLAPYGQEVATPLDLTGLGEVLNEIERPDGEGSLARSDSALLLDFSFAMQRRSRVQGSPRDV
ncbi:hypothetical protein PENSPDRAFT_681596 [Peniophora sp. CONT]|nr:hypothetical protein PENSPDRAFT_681596 [Peniophora sp. CONT]